MPIKDPERKKQVQKKLTDRWYQENKERHKANARKNRQIKKAEWIAFKKTLSCTYCGFAHPAVIDFHHVIRDEPKYSVNNLVSDGRFSKAYEEIKKCIPLCANCHRVLHWDEGSERRIARRKAKMQKKNPPENRWVKGLKKPEGEAQRRRPLRKRQQ